VKNKRHLFLGSASHWAIKRGQVDRTDETAVSYPIRDADNKDIGRVFRGSDDKWAFQFFGKEEDFSGTYDSKEEALEAAREYEAPE
jgi:hypothetical protein